MSKFYAVARGREVGIFPTWTKCKAQVFKFSNAKFKSFETYHAAKIYLDCHNVNWQQGKKVDCGKQIESNLITHYYVSNKVVT